MRALPARALPGAAVVAAPSTADAVRAVAEGARRRRAARGDRHAPRGRALRRDVSAEGVEDDAGERDALRLDRPRGRADAGRPAGARTRPRWCSGAAATAPPGLARALPREFADRDVNLTRIESRPRRRGLGTTCSSATSTGAATTRVAAAIDGLRGHCRGGARARLVPGGARLQPRGHRLHSRQRWPPPYPQAQWGPCRSTTTGGTDRAPTARPLVGWSCAGAQRDVRADQRLHGAPRDGPAAQGEGRGDRDRPARPALGQRAR